MTFDIKTVKSGDLVVHEGFNAYAHYKIYYVILNVTNLNTKMFAAYALDLSIGLAYDGLFDYQLCTILARAAD